MGNDTVLYVRMDSELYTRLRYHGEMSELGRTLIEALIHEHDSPGWAFHGRYPVGDISMVPGRDRTKDITMKVRIPERLAVAFSSRFDNMSGALRDVLAWQMYGNTSVDLFQPIVEEYRKASGSSLEEVRQLWDIDQM